MTAFDLESGIYDEVFTHTRIGISQRNKVHDYIDSILDKNQTIDILELNCGTGEDAKFLSGYGQVLATDYSDGMLDIARSKIGTRRNIEFRKLDLTSDFYLDHKYDLIFSNFGGLNCLSQSQLHDLSKCIELHLNKGGSFLAVLMPRDTILEKWYRTAKNEKHIFQARSNVQPIRVKVNEGNVETFFFNPDEFSEAFATFKVCHTFATGFIPSYLEKSKYFSFLSSLENLFLKMQMNPKYGDHYLIHLKAKS